MLKQIFILFTLIFCSFQVFSANIFVDSDVYLKETYFKYNISFGENESYSSFSFEKPKNSIIEYAYNQNNESINYLVVGDYFIFKPDKTEGENFIIKFKTKDISLEITEKGLFSLYVNFNIPVENFKFSLNLINDFGDIKDIFPRNYEIGDHGQFIWNLKNIEKDTLFLVNYRNLINLEDKNSSNNSNYNIFLNWYKDKYFILILIFFLILIIFLIIFGKKILNILYVNKKNKLNENSNIEEEKKEKIIIVEKNDNLDENIIKRLKTNNLIEIDNSNIKDKTEDKKEEQEGKEGKEEKKESYYEFVNKYLTENEKDVVEIIKEHEGLSQYDILNYLPSMSKSNLSKIISKLHSKKILNRIKVGKVNKIYFGEKLEDLNYKKKE